jgi:hypothetical protein
LHPAFARSITRTGAVLSLLLAAIGLAADAGEYPHLGAPGLRAFAVTSLPLVAAGLLTLAVVRGPALTSRPLRAVALATNAMLLLWSLTALGGGAPPFFFLRAAVAFVLTVSTALVFREER